MNDRRTFSCKQATRRLRAVVAPALAVAILATACSGGNTRPVVGVVGDSITVISAPGLESELRGYALYIRAIDGQRIDEMLPALRAELARHPKAVVINLGTNDALQSQTHPDWQPGFDTAWRLVESLPCVVYVTVNTAADTLYSHGTVAADINTAIRTLAREHHNIRIVDWNAAVHEDPSLLSGAKGPGDSIHPYSRSSWHWLGDNYRDALLACGVHPA